MANLWISAIFPLFFSSSITLTSTANCDKFWGLYETFLELKFSKYLRISFPLKNFLTSSSLDDFFPRLIFSVPANNFTAVDFPIPFLPNSPRTLPSFGVGNPYKAKPFSPYRYTISFSSTEGRLIISIALNGHLLTQMAQPIQVVSSIVAFSEIVIQLPASFFQRDSIFYIRVRKLQVYIFLYG